MTSKDESTVGDSARGPAWMAAGAATIDAGYPSALRS